MKQVDVEQSSHDKQQGGMSADYLLLQTAFKAGEQQRREAADRRQSVPRIQLVDDDGVPVSHRRSHSLKCPSSSSTSSPGGTRRYTCRRAGSVRSTPPRPARSSANNKVPVISPGHTLTTLVFNLLF